MTRHIIAKSAMLGLFAIAGVAAAASPTKHALRASISPTGLRGVVLSFDRDSCPRGWEEYTALRGRGVIGVNPPGPGGAPVNQLPRYDLSVDYGAPTVTLSVDQMPSHAHPYTDIYYSENVDLTQHPNISVGGSVPVPDMLGSRSTDNDNAGLQIQRTTDPAGGGQPVPVQPPVRALLFCKLL